MKQVHLECKPDQLLVSKLGFTRKYVTHHQGKSRVFQKLSKSESLLAMVDEDPGSPKTTYEKQLQLVAEQHGIKYYSDKRKNKIFFLSGKLEDWILEACKSQKIDPSEFGLPDNPNKLHDILNHRLDKFEKLTDELIRQKNPSILQLKSWMQ